MASVADQLPEQAPVAESRSLPWTPVVWFTAILIAANYPVLKYLVQQWINDEDVSHGFFVPIVAGYIVWQRRDKLMALKLEPSWWGAVVMFWGTAQAYLGMLSAELFLQRTSVLILLVGIL